MAELELAEGLLRAGSGRDGSSRLLTLLLPLSSDPRNCRLPQARGGESVRKWHGWTGIDARSTSGDRGAL